MGSLEWRVREPQRLGAFVKERVGASASAREVKRWIESNLCEVNGVTERFASHQLRDGDKVVLRRQQAPPTPTTTIQKLHDDDHLVAFDKPAGVTSEAFAKKVGLPLIHRLDKDTSGVLLFAKDNATKKAMEQLFRRREVAKAYLAVVIGAPKANQGTITGFLGKVHHYQGQTLYGSVPEKEGLYAETSWRCLKRGEGIALLACYPKTGRTHQIRVHMKEMGHPILGDYQYARKQDVRHRPQRHLLHAWKIAFVHPNSGNKLVIEAEWREWTRWT